MCDGLYPSSSRLQEVNDFWEREYAAVTDSSQSDSGRKVCLIILQINNEALRLLPSQFSVERLFPCSNIYDMLSGLL